MSAIHTGTTAVVLVADAFVAFAVEQAYSAHKHLDTAQLGLAAGFAVLTLIVLAWAVKAGRRESAAQAAPVVRQAPRRPYTGTRQ